MAFNNWEKFVEEYNKRNPGDLPEDVATRIPESVAKEFATRLNPADEIVPAPITEPTFPDVHAPSSYDVNVSDSTVTMNGRPESLPSKSPDMPKAKNWELEEDVPQELPQSIKGQSEPIANKAADTTVEQMFPVTDNDKVVREAGLADLEKRRKLGIIPQALAGIGDTISASASAFGGNAPGGSMQRLMDRQDKDIEQGKKDIELKLKNDANSDISKQYQALLGQFMQTDPKDPRILGLTANQIAEKIPAIEKIASLRQQEELKRLQIENTKAIKDQTASEKQTRMADELWTPLGQAKTKNDAKILKDAYMGYEGTKSNLDELIEIRGAKGAEMMDRKSVNRAKTIAADLTVQYKDLAKLGVLSKDDYRLLERLIPSDPLQFDVLASTPASLDEARTLIDRRMEAYAKGYGVSSPVKPTGANPGSQSTPSASNGQRKTKAGHSYTIEG